MRVTDLAYIHQGPTLLCWVCFVDIHDGQMTRIAIDDYDQQGLLHEACVCETCGPLLPGGQHQELCGTGMREGT